MREHDVTFIGGSGSKDRFSHLWGSFEFRRHLAAYEFARRFVRGGLVLDAGCNVGYGCRLLESVADHVVGIDIDRSALRYARNSDPSGEYVVLNVSNMPLRENSIDIVVSFQVIEHLHNPGVFLEEVRRVLKQKALFLLSTPNRRLRLMPGAKPHNPEHIREYELKEFSDLLRRHFDKVTLLGLQASPLAFALEMKRLNPFPIPLPCMIWRLLSSIRLPFTVFPRRVRRIVDMRRSSRAAKITTDDFKVLRIEFADNPLDLVAVCRKD